MKNALKNVLKTTSNCNNEFDNKSVGVLRTFVELKLRQKKREREKFTGK
jgi:hypothetical protein